MKKILFGVFICSICFAACEKDPTFVPETENVSVAVYVGNVGYTYADVYCQISSNVEMSSVVLELSHSKDMKQAESYTMKQTTEYPIETDFDKTNIVFKTNLTNLENGCTYYGRIVMKTTIGGDYEKEGIVFSTESLETSGIITKPATDIWFTYATLNGEVVVASDVNVYQTGFYYSQNSNMENAESVTGNKYYGSFKATIYNLEPNTTYYYQAYASMNGETYHGQKMQFSTEAYTEADVETGEVSDISYASAKCSLIINSQGNSSIKKKGIMYGTQYPLTEANSTKVEAGSSNIVTLKNLIAGELYNYCAYAENASGVSYGKTEWFVTKNLGDIYIETGEATNVGSNRARMYYTIKSEGYQILKYGLIYGDYWSFNSYSLEGNSIYNCVSVAYGTDYEKTDYGYVNTLKKDTYYAFQAYVRYIDAWGDEEIIFGDVETFYTLE